MDMNCNNLIAKMGFVCTPLGDALAICMPITLPDHTPVYVYAREAGNQLELTDAGDTMMHLYGVGLFDNRRLSSSIEKRVARHGGSFESGAVIVRTPKADPRPGFVSYLRAMLDIIDYEVEALAVGNDTASLVNDIVLNINRRNPSVLIEHDVTAVGTTGHIYRFPLKAGDTLIDTVRPSHQSTGAMLRKAADIEKAGVMPPLIIIDDRENREAADRESAIISMLASTMLYSSLQHGQEPLRLLAH